MDKIDKTLQEIGGILRSKQHDYASDKNPYLNFERTASILETTPELVICHNLAQKVSRLNNLLSTGKKPKNEAVSDSVNDLIGYSILLKNYIDDKL